MPIDRCVLLDVMCKFCDAFNALGLESKHITAEKNVKDYNLRK